MAQMKQAFLLLLIGLTACSNNQNQKTSQQADSVPNTQTSLQCSKDTDCKGDRICESGKCISPTAIEKPASQVASSHVASISKPIEIIKPLSNAELMSGLLKQYYPVQNEARNCQGILTNDSTEDGVTGEKYQNGYCVKIDKQQIVDTPKGKRLYVLTTGDIGFNQDGESTEGGHVHSGLVGMFVLKPKGQTWEIESADATINVGAFGAAPTDWSIHQFSPDKWGFLNKHQDGHFGISGSKYVILIPNGKGIEQSWIGGDFDTTDSTVCADDPKACDSASATFKINRDQVVNGFYPLNLLVNGKIDGESYDNKVYQITHHDKGYEEPEGYPLANLDF